MDYELPGARSRRCLILELLHENDAMSTLVIVSRINELPTRNPFEDRTAGSLNHRPKSKRPTHFIPRAARSRNQGALRRTFTGEVIVPKFSAVALLESYDAQKVQVPPPSFRIALTRTPFPASASKSFFQLPSIPIGASSGEYRLPTQIPAGRDESPIIPPSLSSIKYESLRHIPCRFAWSDVDRIHHATSSAAIATAPTITEIKNFTLAVIGNPHQITQ